VHILNLINQGGMTITRYTPEEWREAYGNLIAENGEKLPQRKMAEALRISRTTLQHYLNDPKYRLQEKEVVQKVAQVAQKKVKHSEELIETAFQLHKKGIRDAINAGNWKDARKIALDSLKICHADTEIKRVFINITGDLIQNLTVNQIQDHPQYAHIHSKAMNNDWMEDMGLLCDDCRERISKKYSDDVIDIEGTDEP